MSETPELIEAIHALKEAVEELRQILRSERLRSSPPRLLTIEEAADFLRVSVRTIKAWIADGELQTVNVSRHRGSLKKRLCVRYKDLEVLIASRTIERKMPRAPRQRRPDCKEYV